MNAQTDRRLLYETFIVLALMVIPVFLWPQTKTLTALLVLVYLLIERRLRQRSWEEIGFKFRSFKQDLKANWILVVLVGFVLQLLILGVAARIWPAFLTHVQDRVSGVIGAQVPIMFGVLIFSTLLEELIYRGIFQERFSRVFNPYVVIVVVSVLFAMMHWSEGALPLVLADVGLIVVSSSLYGLIFLRGRNVLVAWLAHLLADVVGLIGLLWLI
ncbi:MAG: CPBP family intramembrane metalloprotease [Caldilineaceae bacterium]|nr:CPBP family intramembrane metalloprotease [Caldilineaceae bacterium]MBP8108107.1 CPBP family intramembrane metalloprotease [Caldilineaceae bacterium]MBP8123091.1 CPBP family intramembrane metalloprotease [Caldilineaceae bacterium]MBP9070738.1 CPBP family intramembrane metalloprotease [Caldilineaceae bacterium]